VRDPIGLYRDASPTGIQPPARKPNKTRRALSYWLFNPDPGVTWAYVAACHPSVLKASSGAAFIISSSPPESVHVGAWKISRKLGLPHIVDMRDGWLDEPLRPILRTSAFRRWQEGRLETQILNDATAILVTSDVWQELLCNRLPKLANKVTVLPNGYPLSLPKIVAAKNKPNDAGLVLVHAGRFSGSDTRRTPDLILQPLLACVNQKASQGTIKLIGSLSDDELAVIEQFVAPFAEHGWRIECPGCLLRQELLELLPQADGLLLLSASFAAIPSKLFEYIPTGRPILVATEQGSATWRICDSLPQAFLIKMGKQPSHSTLEMYLNAALDINSTSTCPDKYDEGNLSKIFLCVIEAI
jgi:hypothetical protein